MVLSFPLDPLLQKGVIGFCACLGSENNPTPVPAAEAL